MECEEWVWFDEVFVGVHHGESGEDITFGRVGKVGMDYM